MESINGWTPPLINEGGGTPSRIATQADIDRLLFQVETLGKAFRETKLAVEHAARLLSAFYP